MADVPQRIYEWLARLHSLTAGSASGEEAQSRIELLAPVVSDAFDITAFTQSSLSAVAAKLRFWPNSGELVAALTEWRRTARPTTLAISGPPQDGGLDGMDLHWLNYYRKREAEGFGPIPGLPRSSPEHVLSLVKQQSPRAWARITGTIQRNLAPTDAEVAYVARLLRPEPVRVPKSGVPTAEPDRPKPAYLSGDALRASREARGCNVPVAQMALADDGWTPAP